MKFFHELSDSEYQALLDEHLTYDELEERYSQPSWCMLPKALEGQFGCWSLLERKIRKEEDCERCEYFNEF